MATEENIYQGELMASVTIPNCCGLEAGKSLSHGDKIDLYIDRIEKLINFAVSS